MQQPLVKNLKITTVSRSLTSTKMARLSIVVSFALENFPVLARMNVTDWHLCSPPWLRMDKAWCMLDIRKYLTSRGWKRDQINFALMQIIAHAIYPYSESKTVRYLRENTALAEILNLQVLKSSTIPITRDSRYACRWVRLTWMENPSRHSWWIVTQRVQGYNFIFIYPWFTCRYFAWKIQKRKKPAQNFGDLIKNSYLCRS